MRKFTFLFFCITLLLCCISTKVFANEQDIVNIPIEKGDDSQKKGNSPRTLVTPISCYFVGGVFQFSFNEIYENIEITIENMITREKWSYAEDDFQTSVLIPASSSPGTYIITIYTDTDYYTGVFNQ